MPVSERPPSLDVGRVLFRDGVLFIAAVRVLLGAVLYEKSENVHAPL